MEASNLGVKGMNTDVLEKFQPEGTYRFALNAVIETEEGDIQGLSNERGARLCANPFPNKKVIGHVLTDTDDIVLFLFDPASTRPEHEIGIYNPNSCKYTTIGKGECLNFKLENQINAIFRLKNGCTRYVYFTDGVNPYRVVNISDTKDWVNNGNITTCEKIRYTRSYTIPKMEGSKASGYASGVSPNGGSLEYGTYSFAIRLIDYDDNPTDWLNFSRYYPIGYSNTTNLDEDKTYNEYVGASNVESEIGYKNRSTKSISLTLTSLDTRFSKYQIAVVKRLSTSGALSEVDLLQPKEIKNPSNLALVSDIFTYTGNDADIFSSTTIDELFSENVKLDKVVAHTTSDNRLFVGGIKNEVKDYSGFQRHASSIKTEWVKRSLSIPTKTSMNSEGYQDLSGLQSDEVYSFGIVYIFKDGTESPVFHIPGRPINITNSPNNPDISYSGDLDTTIIPPTDDNLMDASLNKAWQVYNTYTRNVDNLSGYMGYYESNSSYPTIVTCDDHPDGYWGRDFMGNLVTGKIRHHRTPTYSARPIPNIIDKYITGVKFSVAQDYPSTDVVGHFYVMGERTEENRTVVDTGLMTRVFDSVDDTPSLVNVRRFLNQKNNSTTVKDFWYLSNSTQYSEDLPSAFYVRMLDIISRAPYVQNFATSQGTTRLGKTIEDNTAAMYVMDSGISPTEKNLKIEASSLILKNSKYMEPKGATFFDRSGLNYQTINGINIKNISNSVNFGVLSLDRVVPINISSSDYMYLVSLKVYRDVFSNLDTINYKRLGINYVNKINGVTHTYTTYAGDIVQSYLTLADNEYDENSSGTLFASYNSISAILESSLNTSFRMYDSRYEGKNEIYRGGYDIVNDSADNLLEYLSNKLYKLSEDVLGYYNEFHSISKAYSYYQADKIYLPLPTSYNICSDCNIEDFPYRIYYSEPDTQESERDYFRTIRVNNYKDLDGYTGRLTDLFTFRDNLYALTTSSAYFLPYRPQSIETNEGALYIGTGGVLSLPPRQLKTTDYAFGGTSHFKSRTLTEYGIVYVDDISGRPFLLNEGLSDLSLSGLRNFFQEEGIFKLQNQFKSKNSTYPFISTSSSLGIGYITAYEPRHKRVIIHKKDYSILPSLIDSFQVGTNITTVNTLWFDGNRFVYNSPSGAIYPKLDDPSFFENNSFTVSYSFLTNSFVSFHSYLPEYLFNNYRNLFSNSVYKHDGDYQTYYNKKYDFIVDYVTSLNPKEIKTFSYAKVRNKTYYNGFTNNTFDRAIAYNSYQTSGVVYLDKDKAFDLSPASLQSPVKSVDYSYNISSLRDKTILNTQPIWDKSWTSKQFQYYIDKVPNISNISTTSSLFEQKRLKDYFLGLRLFYNPTLNEKITVDILDVNYSNRNR